MKEQYLKENTTVQNVSSFYFTVPPCLTFGWLLLATLDHLGSQSNLHFQRHFLAISVREETIKRVNGRKKREFAASLLNFKFLLKGQK